MKYDIADDLEWPLKVISYTVNGFVVYVSKTQYYTWTKSITMVGHHMWAIISTVVFDRMDSYVMLNATC